MTRPLEKIADTTPTDYAVHAPKDPHLVAVRMIEKARERFPRRDTGEVFETAYRFLFVGPGAGLVVRELVDMEQQARGIETSKRGITTAPETVWSYIAWTKPWETAFGNRSFDVCLINRYMKSILSPEEWSKTATELKRISKYVSLI